MNLSYEIIENGQGYVIKNDGRNWWQQVEPFIPYRGDTIEESAQNHIDSIIENESKPVIPVPNEIEELKAQNAQIILALVNGGLM